MEHRKSTKLIGKTISWEERGYVRRELSAMLGEPLSGWLRAHHQRGYTADQIRDLLSDQTGYAVTSAALREWKVQLGLTKSRVRKAPPE